MKARTIVNDIYEVGIRDWTLHDFHGFATPRGVTYNSFLIMDEKICLIDGVKAPFAGEQLSNIRTIVDPEKIDYIVVNHVEPDHSGSLPALAQACPNATFLITVQGANELKEHYGDIFKTQIVKKGDTVSLGKRTLAFQPIPMLHWPDSWSPTARKNRSCSPAMPSGSTTAAASCSMTKPKWQTCSSKPRNTSPTS